MAIKNNAQVAEIECPMCHGLASVHSCMIGRGAKKEALYIRCGTVSNGCGCIQPYGPTGQQFIRDNMRNPVGDLAPAPKTETVAEPGQVAANDEWAPEQETESQPEKPKKRGLLAALLEE
ncbi:MAG: hypothetical protein CMP77_01995 [Flavobacterium sp.]|nr:hypothetical protein [Flavobacterium sp.]MBE98731.1 hypothetical protein [Flavobacterium sp.]|tara:strand:+ start:10313 stop:10672 length:360 start_codon:yes stop_codon:yes gene_type:complete